MLKAYPYISFGNDAISEYGEAFRFGAISQLINHLIKIVFKRTMRAESINLILLSKSLILHNLNMLEKNTIPLMNGNIQGINDFEIKKREVLDWLNVVDLELNLRRTKNKTLIGVAEEYQNEIKEMRGSPINLNSFINSLDPSFLKDNNEEQNSKISPKFLNIFLSKMSPAEVEYFMSENNELISDNLNLDEFSLYYAINRWLIIKNERAEEEGLMELLEEALNKISSSNQKINIFDQVINYLDINSNRLLYCPDYFKETFC